MEESAENNWGNQPIWQVEMPSLLGFWRKHDIQVLDEVIALRHYCEWNYFHFHFDVLGKLPVLEDAGVPSDVPLLLGSYALRLPWVQEILHTGHFRDRKWIVQDSNQYIRANRIYYCRTGEPLHRRADYITKQLCGPEPIGNRMIFLNRGGGQSRRIVNIDDVRAVLRSYGFEEVDTGGMPVAEQMSIFASTRYLVAIHGAGLTNVIHRQGRPLDVLELHADAFNSFEFKRLCEDYGYGWHGLAGATGQGYAPLADFSVDIAALRAKLASMCASLHPSPALLS